MQSVGVTPEVNLRIIQAKNHARDPPEVQNRGISGSTKRPYVLQNLKKKQKRPAIIRFSPFLFPVVMNKDEPFS